MSPNNELIATINLLAINLLRMQKDDRSIDYCIS